MFFKPRKYIWNLWGAQQGGKVASGGTAKSPPEIPPGRQKTNKVGSLFLAPAEAQYLNISIS